MDSLGKRHKERVLVMTTTTVIHKVVQEVKTEQVAVEFQGDALNLLNEFFVIRKAINDLEKTKKEMEEQLKTLIGKAEVITANGAIRAEVSTRTREGTDVKTLEKLFPEAFLATRTKRDYTVLVAK
jgi:predicted phage-related endonuclease